MSCYFVNIDQSHSKVCVTQWLVGECFKMGRAYEGLITNTCTKLDPYCNLTCVLLHILILTMCIFSLPSIPLYENLLGNKPLCDSDECHLGGTNVNVNYRGVSLVFTFNF